MEWIYFNRRRRCCSDGRAGIILETNAPLLSRWVIALARTSSTVVTPCGDEAPAVIGQSGHAVATGRGEDLVGGGGFQDQLADLLVGIHPFKDGVPAEEAGVAAFCGSRRQI